LSSFIHLLWKKLNVVINFNVYNPSLINISHTSLTLESTVCGSREMNLDICLSYPTRLI